MSNEEKMKNLEKYLQKSIDKYLPGWNWRWDKATRRYGCCHHNLQLITISKAIAELNPFEETRKTILHEIAHGMIGAEHGHDDAWRLQCINLGIKPERCYGYQVKTPLARYQAVCEKCGHTYSRRRCPKRPTSCGRCCKTFNSDYILTYHDTQKGGQPIKIQPRKVRIA